VNLGLSFSLDQAAGTTARLCRSCRSCPEPGRGKKNSGFQKEEESVLFDPGRRREGIRRKEGKVGKKLVREGVQEGGKVGDNRHLYKIPGKGGERRRREETSKVTVKPRHAGLRGGARFEMAFQAHGSRRGEGGMGKEERRDVSFASNTAMMSCGGARLVSLGGDGGPSEEKELKQKSRLVYW